MNQNKATNCLLARWAMVLGGYKYNVKYKPGAQMGHADGLSRLPSELVTDEVPLQVELEYVASLDINEEEVIKKWLQGQAELPSALQSLKQQNVQLENDNIYVNNRTYVPRERLPEVMERIHAHPLASAHFGVKKTFDKFRNFFFSPGAYEVAKRICDTCPVCQLGKPINHTPRTALGTVKAIHRWEIISLDISGTFPETKRYNKYILTVVDLFTKYTILIPISDTKAVTIARSLLRHVFAHYSIPKEILTDQGRQFESQLFQELCELLQIHKIRTSSYHPQGNAINERSHATVNNLLRMFILENQETEWDELLPMIMLAINSNLQETINYTPYEAMFGKKPQLPDDLIYGEKPYQDYTQTEDIQKLQFQLDVINQNILSRQSKVHLAQARQYSRKGKATWYIVGDYVLAKYIPKPGENHKLAPQWEGPFIITSTEHFPVIEIIRENNPTKAYNLHHDRLKFCKINKENTYLKNFPSRGTYFNRKKTTYPFHNLPRVDTETTSEEDSNGQDNHSTPTSSPMESSEEDNFHSPEEEVENIRSPEAMSRYNLRPRPKIKTHMSL